MQSDFGLKDSSVAEMIGTVLTVNKNIKIVGNTHLIEQFSICDGVCCLLQSIKTFPEKIVFVSVVDPGVCTNRKSIVFQTKENHYILTPNNGIIKFIDKEISIAEVCEIDEAIHRVAGS